MNKFNKYFCQHCGGDTVMEGVIFDDEATIDENGNKNYCGLSDEFEHNGINYCKQCGEAWTGAECN